MQAGQVPRQPPQSIANMKEQEPAIEVARNRLAVRVKLLDEVVLNLRERLSRVLRPNGPCDPSGQIGAVAMPSSEFAADLDATCDRLQVIEDGLCDILRRLDI